MTKRLLLIFISCLFVGGLSAQNIGNFYNIDAGMGYHGLAYSINGGTQTPRIGYNFNVGYSLFFSKQWGFHTGIGVQTFSSMATFSTKDSFPDNDSEGDSRMHRIRFSNSHEIQQAIYAEMPFAIHHRMPLATDLELLTTLGLKVIVPVAGNVSTIGDSIYHSGYYAKWHVPIDNVPHKGLHPEVSNYSKSQAFKSAFMTSLDVGVLYAIGVDADLYMGTYFNYGLGNIISNEDKQHVYEENNGIGTYNGVLSTNMVEKVTPFSFGIKIGLLIHVPNFGKYGLHGGGGGGRGGRARTETFGPATGTNSYNNRALDYSQFIYRGQVYKSKSGVTISSSIRPKPVLPELPDSVRHPKTRINLADDGGATTSVTNIGAKDSLMTAKNGKLKVKNKGGKNSLMNLFGKKQNDSTLLAQKESAKTPDELKIAMDSIDKETDEALEKVKAIMLNLNLRFAFGSSKVTTPDMAMVHEVSNILLAHPAIKLRIVGHTDNTSSLQVNIVLGRKRAMSVQKLFEQAGVPTKQLIIGSRAFLEPLFPNTNEKNRAANRRAEIFVIKQAGKSQRLSDYLGTSKIKRKN
jgi:outer membrane protein OmpA-like peptidoglycan-associated protein